MTRKTAAPPPAPDEEDTPEWTDDQLDRAELAVGGTVIRPANGTLTRACRTPPSYAAEQEVTLEIDADVLTKFREGGPGWQERINAALRAAAGL